MKKHIILLLLIFTVKSQEIIAQLPAVDPLSGAGSIALTVEYALLEGKEREVTAAVSDFTTNYSKRIWHKFDPKLTVGDDFRSKIVNELEDAFGRILLLNKRNEDMVGMFSEARKENNREKLNVVKANLINTREKFKKKLKSFGVYGEKMNLYQNFMMSLHEVHRSMDEIESKIDKGYKLGSILKN